MAHPKAGYRLSGKRVPGTTTIIGRFKDSGGLLYWAYKQGQCNERGEIGYLYEERDEAADAGTMGHDMFEAYIYGRPYEMPEATDLVKHYAEQAFNAAVTWFEGTRIKIVRQEVRLISEKHEFGGCPDAIGELDGKRYLLDWKTSKGGGVYVDYLLQLAAYKHLVEDGLICDEAGKSTTEKLGLEIDGGFHLCKFSKGEHTDFHHHFWSNLDDAWDQFKLFRRAYDLDKKLKARV